MTRTTFGLLLVSGVLALAACSPGEELAEQIAESQEGVGDVEIDEDSGEVSVEGDEGSATFGGGELPDDFPIDMPDDGSVQSVIEDDGDVIATVSYEEEFSTIAGHFEDWVDNSGMEVVNRFESSDPQSITWALEEGDSGHNLTVTAADETVQVTVLAGED